MSFRGALVSIPNTLNLDEVRLAFLEGLSLARVLTVLSLSGAHDLDGDADLILADCGGGSFTVNLPLAPAVDGDSYEFMLVSASGTLTIGRNGETINGAASDATVATQWTSKRATWSADLDTWVVR